MRQSRSIKTELVISMTLAEIFLLMLFVVWYSVGAGAGPEWERIAKERERQINDLNEKIHAQDEQIANFKKLEKLWLDTLGIPMPTTTKDLRTLFPNGANGGDKNGRSNFPPKCSDEGLKDVLFSAVIEGRDLFKLNGEDKKFEEIKSTYGAELSQAQAKRCRYSVEVFYKKNLGIDDYTFALDRLRSTFYTGRLSSQN